MALFPHKRQVLVFFAFAAVWFGTAVRAEAATLRLTPASGSFVLGGTFDVSVVLNTQGVPVNTIAVELRFPPDKLQIVNPSLGRSIIQIWATQPVFSNQEGRVYFVGGIPSPGVNTSEGVVQALTFRVVSAGEARVSFGDASEVLANDGLGTNVLAKTSPAAFRFILPPGQGPKIFSPSHPEEGKWYKDPNPQLIWDKSAGSEGFSFSIDRDPGGVPDTVIEGKESQASFQNLESGTWYFHVREKAGPTWSGVSHYLLNIDTLPPAAFRLAVSPGFRTSSKNPILRFFTTDSLSGFDHFEIKVVPLQLKTSESPFFFEGSSPHQLSRLTPGRYEVIVRAFDRAGNSRDESETMHIVSSLFQFVSSEGVDFVFFFVPWSIFLPILLALILVIMGVLVYISWRHGHHVRQIVAHDFRRAAGAFVKKRYVQR